VDDLQKWITAALWAGVIADALITLWLALRLLRKRKAR